MVITHLIVDTRDAMGANEVNSMADAVTPHIAEWTGGRTCLRNLSNLAVRRVVRARPTWQLDDIGGADVRDGILTAYHFAAADPYRAATHNKGIMNGASAVALATGNDTRALEAGAHAYAARNGQYTSLTHWETDADGHLTGVLEMPVPMRSEEHTSELQSRFDIVCRLLLEKKKNMRKPLVGPKRAGPQSGQRHVAIAGES